MGLKNSRTRAGAGLGHNVLSAAASADVAEHEHVHVHVKQDVGDDEHDLIQRLFDASTCGYGLCDGD